MRPPALVLLLIPSLAAAVFSATKHHAVTYDIHSDEPPEHHAAHAFGPATKTRPKKWHASSPSPPTGTLDEEPGDLENPWHAPPPHVPRNEHDWDAEWKSYWSAYHRATASHKASSLLSASPTASSHGGAVGGGGRVLAWMAKHLRADHPWTTLCSPGDSSKHHEVSCADNVTDVELSRRFATGLAGVASEDELFEARDANPVGKAKLWKLYHHHIPFCGQPGIVCGRGLTDETLADSLADGEPGLPEASATVPGRAEKSRWSLPWGV